MSESESQIKEIKRVYAGLETLYHAFSKIRYVFGSYDLLRRLHKNPNDAAIYMIEVFTKRGVNPEAAKKYIFDKTGMVPAIYEKSLQIRNSPWKCSKKYLILMMS